MSKEILELFLVTDIHHGAPLGTKRSDQSQLLLDNFITSANNYKPDLVIDLGDRINDLDHPTDLGLLRDVAEQFKMLKCHREHLVGNHDIHFLSIQENESLLESVLQSRSSDLNGWHLIFWCPNAKYSPTSGFVDDQPSLKWLQKNLRENDKPTIIFCHVPQFVGDLSGNYWFGNNPWAASLPYAQSVLKIIEKDPNVKMTVGGHVHWPRLATLHGVHHITLPSIIESFFSNGEPCGAWTKIIIDKQIHLSINGRESYHWSLPVRNENMVWPDPRPSNRIK